MSIDPDSLQRSCGGCEQRATASVSALTPTDVAALPAGRYYVRIGAVTETAVQAALVVERIADGLAPGGAQ